MIAMNDLIGFVIAVGIVGLLAGAAALALDAFNDDLTADSVADNVTDNGLTGLLNVTSQLGTIGTIVGVAVLIGIVIAAFKFGRN